MKMVRLAVLVIVLLVVFTIPASAQQQTGGNQRDPQFEQAIYDRLGKVNEKAVQVFKDATAAMDAENYSQAKTGFEQVLLLAPDFPDALRRLAFVESSLSMNEAALQHAQKANQIAPSPENKSTLAVVLLSFNNPRQNREAYNLALEASQADPADPQYLTVLAYASWAVDEKETFKQTAANLLKVAPANPNAHFYAGISAAFDGRWEQAERELIISEKMGMPKESVEKVLSGGIRTQARIQAGIRWGEILLAAWLASLVAIFLVGLFLSRLTLRTVRRQAQLARFEIRRGERWIRQIYRVVVTLASVYYYISIPIVILLVLGIAAGFAYFILSMGSIRVQLVVFAAIAILGTLYALVRSLFVRIKDVDPGRPLSRAEEPYLWQSVEAVARRMETRSVDAIFLTPGVEAAVWERGGFLQKLQGKGKRCLILGIGALKAMTQGQLQAILAHEYGHFLNRDTAGGNLASQVRASIFTMGGTLIANRLAHWYNPAWLFVSNYYKVFSRVVLGASRLQEILADRYAALCYGATNLEAGLTSLIRQDLVFSAQMGTAVELAQAEKRGLSNVYASSAVPEPEKLEDKFQETMQRPSGPYESHPSMKERFEYIDAITAGSWIDINGEDNRPAWDLLSNGRQWEEEMTQVIDKNLHARNIL
jgi:Zn-dependent protease with chaperone function